MQEDNGLTKTKKKLISSRVIQGRPSFLPAGTDATACLSSDDSQVAVAVNTAAASVLNDTTTTSEVQQRTAFATSRNFQRQRKASSSLSSNGPKPMSQQSSSSSLNRQRYLVGYFAIPLTDIRMGMFSLSLIACYLTISLSIRFIQQIDPTTTAIVASSRKEAFFDSNRNMDHPGWKQQQQQYYGGESSLPLQQLRTQQQKATIRHQQSQQQFGSVQQLRMQQEKQQQRNKQFVPGDEALEVVGGRLAQEEESRYSDNPKLAVFYNIYVSPNETLAEAGRSIITEQIGQLGRSYAGKLFERQRRKQQQRLTVYYNTIANTLDPVWMYNLCTVRYDLSCVLLKHYDTANEEVTLTDLHDYCSEDENVEDTSVIYMHTKGSFHPSSLHPAFSGQDEWRRSMTAAVTSEECVKHIVAGEEDEDGNADGGQTCNACGLLFQPLPGLHFPGNIWTAKCSYISKLLSPLEFHERRHFVDEWVDETKTFGTFKADLFHYHELNCIGKGRYESEHWMGSHPSLVPCDVSQTAYLDYWLQPAEEDGKNSNNNIRDYDKEFQWSLAPRHDWSADWVWHKYSKRDTHNKTLHDGLSGMRLREYFLLRGVISRWLAFYDELPDVTLRSKTSSMSKSWVWNWYPDGDVWRRGIMKYGKDRVVDSVVSTPILKLIRGYYRQLFSIKTK